MRTRKIKSAGRYGPRYGAVVKEKTRKVEAKQRQKQKCPLCKKYSARRLAKGLWFCKSCNKRFTAQSYHTIIHKSI